MSDTNQNVQAQKMARDLKFPDLEIKGLYNLCSENKDTDQLHGHQAADLCLCFLIPKKADFLMKHLSDLACFLFPCTAQPHYNTIFGVHRKRPCYK